MFVLKPKEYGQTGGLNPGFLNVYQVFYQLSYLAWGNPLFCHFEFMNRLHIQQFDDTLELSRTLGNLKTQSMVLNRCKIKGRSVSCKLI